MTMAIRTGAKDSKGIPYNPHPLSPHPSNMVEGNESVVPIDHEVFQKTQAQLAAIEKEIKESQPLTSDLMDIASLKLHYDANYFLLGIDELTQKYSKIRKTRGDGNCYYRSFLYNLCEALLQSPTEKARVIQYGMR
jgi:hypothetical protein